MKVALLGATGFVGSALLKEALDRGHVVTAIVRHPEKLEKREGLTAKAGDVYDTASLATLIHSVGYSFAPMAPDNTALGGTRFTVSIDAKERDVTTGISASFAVSPLHCSIFSTRHDVVPVA
jgi:uncharacterized protein YbjT (DUF2867 family)